MTAQPINGAPPPDPAIRTGLCRVRITGQPEDVRALAGQLRGIVDVLSVSDDFPGRTGQDLVHRFASVMLRR
jgi:hypothetical protein